MKGAHCLYSWYIRSTQTHIMKKTIFVSLLLIPGFAVQAQQLVGSGKAVDPYKCISQKSGVFTQGAVASANPLASQVGVEIMKRGGNAFDAAIATQLALAVVYPIAGNIGGGGFLLGRTAKGELLGLDFREKAPMAASRDMYLDKQGNAQFDFSQNGHLASGVPGTVAGLFATLPYAKLPFNELIQPAIDLAEFGFVLSQNEATGLNWTKESFQKYSTQVSAFVKNTDWQAGDTLIQKELASTLKRIRDKGAKGFYRGKTAQLLVAEMHRRNGIISKKDLRQYEAKNRTPLQFNYKGNEVIGFPPPSSGGIIVAQVLKMLADNKLETLGFQSEKSVQLLIEAERIAFADRAEHLGDPDYWQVPVEKLLNTGYLTTRMTNFIEGKAGKSSETKAGNFSESTETTHLSIYDKEGNMVAVTTTLNGAYGSKTVVGGAGFLLNNEMDDFSIKAGVPNMYGAVGSKANAIAPNKRMLSSMSPTLVLKDNKPYIIVGTPGGTTIPTSIIQTLINLIDFKLGPMEANNSPKFHHQWLPDAVAVEKDFPQALQDRLIAMGYTLRLLDSIGRTELIVIDANGTIQAVADIRGEDSVAGF
jgi:gamma-glutamyltranspeptidase/glutathione hydrolase